MSEIRKQWWAEHRDEVKVRMAQLHKGLKKARRIPRAKPHPKPDGQPRPKHTKTIAREELESLARRGAKQRLIELEQEMERLRIFLSVE